MKRIMITTALLTGLLLILAPAMSSAQTRFGFRLEIGGPTRTINHDYYELGLQYGVPYDDIYAMHYEGVPDCDIPVILYIHANSPYSLRQIYSLRLRGATWENLSAWCGVPINTRYIGEYSYRNGPPYGNAYGYYEHGPGRWKFKGNHGRGHHGDDD